MKKPIWTKKEIELLEHLYVNEGLSYNDIYLKFKNEYGYENRTIESIHVKIKRLKFKHSANQTFEIKRKNVSGSKNPMFGKDSPNKGLNKENSERIKIASDKISTKRKQMFIDGLLPNLSGDKNPMFGKIPWSFGLTKENDIRLFNSGRVTSEYRKKEWMLKTDEEKQIVIDRLNKAMMNQHKPTKIEIKVGNYLKSENINFIKNYKLNGFYIDFYLVDYNIALECDGDWWHVNPLFYNREDFNGLSIAQRMTIKRDLRKNKMFEVNDVKFLRFWEYDIHKNFEDIKQKINDITKQILNE